MRHFTSLITSLAVLTGAFLPLSAQAETDGTPETQEVAAIVEVAPDPSLSLLRVNVTAQAYNYYQPWEKGKPTTRRGLGVILEGDVILVTAQMVADATYVELEKPSSGEKVTGRVKVVDYEANLSLIELEEEDSDFLEGTQALGVDTSAVVGDVLDVWQVKDNGLSDTTSCPLIEVSVENYFLEGTPFLTYQIRGSLRYHAGSYVLPVLHGDKLAGLLMSYDSDEQISRVLAAPIIRHFLDDLNDEDYAGFPTLGLAYARAIDDQLRKYLQLEDDMGGVYVTTVVPDSTADQSGIEVGDVLLEIGGNSIDKRGFYDHPDYGKLNLSHIVRGDCRVGQEVPMVVFRDGERLELEAKMTRKSPKDYLIDPFLFDEGPRFHIAGGLVFQELTKPYLRIFGDQWRQRAPMKLLWALAHPEEYEESGREKLVFISRVIRTPATLGYESVSHVIVDKVNGRPIHRLEDLVEAFQDPGGPFHRVEIAESPHELILDVRMTQAMDERLGEAFRIRDLSRLD